MRMLRGKKKKTSIQSRAEIVFFQSREYNTSRLSLFSRERKDMETHES